MKLSHDPQSPFACRASRGHGGGPRRIQSAAAPPRRSGAGCWPCDAPISNPIACENTQDRQPPSEWDIIGAGDSSIQGFATDISVNQGQTVRSRSDTTRQRLPHRHLPPGLLRRNGRAQGRHHQPRLDCRKPAGLSDATPRPAWSTAATGPSRPRGRSRPTRSRASTSRKLVRDDTAWRQPHRLRRARRRGPLADAVPDLRHHLAGLQQLRRQQPLRGQPRRPRLQGQLQPAVHHSAVSRRTPGELALQRRVPDGPLAGAQRLRRAATPPASTPTAAARELLEHNVFLSVGHDEYWSAAQRANVEAARDAGVHLAFFSGNEVFWKTRWENSIDGSDTAYRTLVSTRRRTPTPRSIRSPTWTGTWRDPRFSPPADGGKPENALTGTIFTVNGVRNDTITGAGGRRQDALLAQHDRRAASARARPPRWRPARSATSGTRTSTTASAGGPDPAVDHDVDVDHRSTCSTTATVGATAPHAQPDALPPQQRRAGLRRRHDPVVLGARRHPRSTAPIDARSDACSRRPSTCSPTWASSRGRCSRPGRRHRLDRHDAARPRRSPPRPRRDSVTSAARR